MTNPIILLESSSDEEYTRKPSPIVAPIVAENRKRKTVASRKPLDLHVSSSSSDDDDDIPTTSVFTGTSRRPLVSTTNARQKITTEAQREKDQRKAAKEQERQKKLQQKEREKLERAELRKRQKQEKKDAKSAEKLAKEDRKQVAAQRMGKFSLMEVGVLVNHVLKDALQENVFDGFEETYETTHKSRGIDIGAIQFIRRDHLDGGAKAAVEALEKKDPAGYQLVDRLLIVVNDPDDFLKLLDRSDTDDDYPKLEEWLEEKQIGWKKKWKTNTTPKILILLPGIIDEIHKRWNNATARERPTLMTDADLQDAIVWFLVAFQVECQPLSSMEQVLATMLKMTRAVSEQPYAQQVTELECVRKIKSTIEWADPTPMDRAQDAWVRMVQMIPGMSANRAEQLVAYYPTAKSLWQAYQGKTEEERALLVAHLFDDKRQYKKLSEQLSIVMTGTNPNKLLT